MVRVPVRGLGPDRNPCEGNLRSGVGGGGSNFESQVGGPVCQKHSRL